MNIFKKLFPLKNKLSREEQLDELQTYLIHSENLFFESSFVHTLKSQHRKSLLVALRLFYPGADYNETSYRHYVYNFIANWYKFNDIEMREHCEKYPVDRLFEIFDDLPKKSKVGILLLINCILYIDKNASTQQKQIAKSIYGVMGIKSELYLKLMKEIGLVYKDKWFSYIHNNTF